MGAQTARSVVPAKAGTHGKYMQELCILLPWVPAYARTAVWNPCQTSFNRRS
jgi:hypothetical protein